MVHQVYISYYIYIYEKNNMNAVNKINKHVHLILWEGLIKALWHEDLTIEKSLLGINK